jgi:cryptochrome
MPPTSRVIYWFRTDLRLHDSPALAAALDLKPECLYPIWTWDPHFVYRARVGVNRWQFLIDCQNDVSQSITKINKKSKLLVLREAPQTLLPKLFKAWRITHLVFEKDTDAYARERDEQVCEIAREMNVQVVVKSGRTLYDSDLLVKTNHGKPTMTIAQVQAAATKIGKVEKPIPAPTSLPDPGDLCLDFEQEKPPSEPDFNRTHRKTDDGSYEVGISGPNGDFSVPTLEELGLQEATTPHRGGESLALEVLDNVISNETFTATFSKPETAPTAFEPQSTCLTSPHLHFGSLSCRLFWHKVQQVLDNYKGKASEPPTSLHGQLLFRDMYFGAQAALGYSFSQTVNNDHCRFIPWHLPSKVDDKTGLITGEYEIDDPEKEEWFRRWRRGQTGFPWIDALMRQLALEGWIHHLGRHAVACFLTRGGCYIHWERGAEVFEELLIDHETACNTGNWQWLSCTAFFSQFFRCYSPIAFPKKWDKDGEFVRKYVPELKNIPTKYIYEPWKAPIQDQKKAGVLVKGDGSQEQEGTMKLYPKPIFDFPTRRDICLKGMKGAYGAGLYGNSPKVLDGTWKELFDDDAEGPTEGREGGAAGSLGKREDDAHDAGDDKQVSKAQPTRKRGKEGGQSTLESSFKKAKK